MNDKISLLQKIKSLSERGVASEKNSAKKILSRLMAKYGISESDISAEKKRNAVV